MEPTGGSITAAILEAWGPWGIGVVGVIFVLRWAWAEAKEWLKGQKAETQAAIAERLKDRDAAQAQHIALLDRLNANLLEATKAAAATADAIRANAGVMEAMRREIEELRRELKP